MNLVEFIAQIEGAYPRQELGKYLRQLYLTELAQFTERQLEKMFSPIVRSCDFLPKISEIWKIAGQLDFLDVPALTSISPQKKEGGCSLCDGSLWVRVKLKHPLGGADYEALRECSCTKKGSQREP